MANNSECMFLVLLETSGNQNFIFATNKLRENVGASELTYRAGTKWVLEVVGAMNKTPNLEIWKDSDRLRQNLLNTQLNPAIETSDQLVEIIIATSGKALLLTKDEETAKEIIKQVTLKALKEAPGIDLCGAFVEFNWNENYSLTEAIKKVYRKFESVHTKYPSPNLRFLRLPIVDECSTSGLPASQLNPLDQKPISRISYQKQDCLDDSLDRMNQILKQDKKQRKFVKNVNQLERRFDNLDWLAVVHADGNGLGQIFLNFEESLVDKNNNREYVDKLRRFSIALDICTERSFLVAIDAFETGDEGILPVVPLIIGGDDLTIICDGKSALKFTYQFLKAFETETAKLEHEGGIIPEIAQKALQANHLSACAGVAIIKPHFPFSVAYKLAEDLIKQAKVIKKKVIHKETNNSFPCSALDFHILYDSSGVELEVIRERLTVDNKKTKLYNRPYIVTNTKQLQESESNKWTKFHHWSNFQKWIDTLTLKDEKKRPILPTSQLNNLRTTALNFGRTATDAQYQLIRHRYSALKELEGEKNSLFAVEPQSDNVYATGLFDALEAVNFVSIEDSHESPG